MSLFDDDATEVSLSINENYAQRFTVRKQREELTRCMYPARFSQWTVHDLFSSCDEEASEAAAHLYMWGGGFVSSEANRR